MNITLQEDDIKKAVRLYIERQGIHLANKSLDIKFNMGRGENGLAATLKIEDVSIPGFGVELAASNLGQTGPSDAVKELVKRTSKDTKEVKETKDTKAPVPVVELVPAVAVVDGALEVPKTAPASLAEIAEVGTAGVATASIATPETEAAAADPIAEAKVAEAAPATTTVAAEVQAKPTTSLFG